MALIMEGEHVRSSVQELPVRRIRLFRTTQNGDDDPRVREAMLREENAWLREENTRLELECERLKQRYSAARAGLRNATGCETPSPRAQTQAAQQIADERRGQTPQQRAFDSGFRQGQEDGAALLQEDRSPITDEHGVVLDIRENVIRRETADERFERQMTQTRRDNRRKAGLVIFAGISFFVTVMLYLHPIILTWILNWEIR